MGANLVADRAPARVIGLQREVSMSGWLPASIAHNIEMMHVPKEPRADDATDVMRDVPLDDRVPSTVDGGDEVLLIHYAERFPDDIDAFVAVGGGKCDPQAVLPCAGQSAVDVNRKICAERRRCRPHVAVFAARARTGIALALPDDEQLLFVWAIRVDRLHAHCAPPRHRPNRLLRVVRRTRGAPLYAGVPVAIVRCADSERVDIVVCKPHASRVRYSRVFLHGMKTAYT